MWRMCETGRSRLGIPAPRRSSTRPCTSRPAAPASGCISRATVRRSCCFGGLGDPAESLAGPDRRVLRPLRVVAPDNRGAGRSSLPAAGVTFPRCRGCRRGARRSRSGTRTWPASRWAARSPRSSRSASRNWSAASSSAARGPLPASTRRMLASWIVGARNASSERELLETFFLWIDSREWHEDGTVDRLIEETLESPSLRTRTGSTRRSRRASTGRAPRRGSGA